MVYPEMSGDAAPLIVTSSVTLTATRNLFVPNTGNFTWPVKNMTTGGQTINVLVSGGTSVPVANGLTITVVCDGTNCTTGPQGTLTNLAMQVVPPISGQYVVIYPTSHTLLCMYGNCGAPAGFTPTASNNSAEMWIQGKWLGGAGQAATWSGFTLPSYVSAANVTAVYAVAVSSFFGTSYLDFQCSGTNLSPISGSYPMQQVTALNTYSGSVIPSISCGANVYGDSGYVGHLNVASIALIVYYTGTPPPATTAIQVVAPAFYNPSTNTLGVDPNTPFPGEDLQPTIVANLPFPANPPVGSIYMVADGTNSADCTTGGGTVFVFCQTNGTAWTSIVTTSTGLLATGATTGATSQAQVFTDGVTLSNLSSYSGNLASIGSGGALSNSGIAASNVPLLNAANTFSNTGNTSFAGNVGIGTSPTQMLSVGSGSPFTVTSAGYETNTGEIINVPTAVSAIHIKNTTYGGYTELVPSYDYGDADLSLLQDSVATVYFNSAANGIAIGSGYNGANVPTNGLLVQGNVSIGDATAAAMFNVGTANQFQVSSTGVMSAAAGSTVGTKAICLADGTGGCVTLGGALSCSNLNFGTGAGTSPTCTSVNGYDSNFIVNITTGTTPAANSPLFTVTFTASRGHISACSFSPVMTAYLTNQQIPGVDQSAPSATIVQVNSSATALTGSTQYFYTLNCP
jgi:hypothetical protein